MKPLPRILLGLAALLLCADVVVSYAYADKVTQHLLNWLNQNTAAPVTFREARVHPLFLSFSAKDLEVFDPQDTQIRLLYSKRVYGRLHLPSLLAKKLNLTSLHFEEAEVKLIKDAEGEFSLEKTMALKTAAHPLRASGVLSPWKRKDWIYDFYQRLKYAVRGQKSRKITGKLNKLVLTQCKVILSDRLAKPLVFEDLHISVKGLTWDESGDMGAEAVHLRGLVRANRLGRYEIIFKRKPLQASVLLSASDIDLRPLKSFYKNTSPVVFERGYLTLNSRTTLTPDRIFSKNALKITDFRMTSSATWSPESQAVLTALNSHKEMRLRFQVNGNPDKPLFEGVEDSMIAILKRNFRGPVLDYIRRRVTLETLKISDLFGGN